jgi:hypothetical protein
LKEEWRRVIGFDAYEVSSLGNVRSVDRDVIGVDGIRQRFKGKPLRLMRSPKGHLFVSLCQKAKYTRIFVHRLVLEAFVGPCPPNMQTCHNNGDGFDNRVENLRWDTARKNAIDAIRHGKSPAKLTEELVCFIRSLIPYYGMKVDLAKAFGVSPITIYKITYGKKWKYLLDPVN